VIRALDKGEALREPRAAVRGDVTQGLFPKGSVAKTNCDLELEEAWRHVELIGVKPPVVRYV
jgi:hypothetical protein